MAISLKDIGQLSPIGVIETDSGLSILFGNTRFLAANKLGWKEISATTFPADTSAADCLRISISENSVREQMTFVESFDAIHEYAKLRGLPINKAGLTQAGKELNYKPSQISKCLGTNDRLSPKNKKMLLDAKIAPSLAYLISREDSKLQDQLVDAVITEGWSRKQLEQHFREKKKGGTKFEFRKSNSKILIEVPKTATHEAVLQLLKSFASELKKCTGLNLSTAAKVIKEQANAL